MTVPASSTPRKASLSINFIIIGGCLSGLATAYALRRIGHRALVLEKNPDFFNSNQAGGCRMPPNLSKVFYHWGLEEQVRKLAMKSTAVSFRRLESGEPLGKHTWEAEVLKETGGDFIFAHHADLRKFLYDQALGAGAELRANSHVIDVDARGRTVTLESGEKLTADVIIGADGSRSFTRELVIGGSHKPTKTGMIMYNALISGKDVKQDPELAQFLNSSVQHVWFGNGAAALVYELGGTQDLGFHLYVQGEGDFESDAPVEQVVKDSKAAEIQQVIQKFIKLSKNIVRIPVLENPEMEDWVHDDGPLLVIGDAAHLMPPGSVQSACMGIEDAAVLAKLFSHLTSFDQIQTFLYAFQDLRQSRCRSTLVSEMGNLYFMALPDGEAQIRRDAAFREKHARGVSPLADDSSASDEWETIKELFGYDAEDEADNWWMQWGLLRERAQRDCVDLGLQVALDVRVDDVPEH